MAWAEPLNSKRAVDKAGEALIDSNLDVYEYIKSLGIVDNWRSSHSFPLNTFQVGLRKRARQIDSGSLVAQRIKRLSSIELKLTRFSGIRLSQIQDIGGCRAIVEDVESVKKLAEMYRKSELKHKLVRLDDYIETPQISGYRGIHLIYRYNSDRNETYNGLQIEMQLRSQFQHAWATAVETVGTFIQQALKSNQGEDRWLRFFALMGCALAFFEGTPPVKGTYENFEELSIELRELANELDVVNRLLAYGAALRTLEETTTVQAKYFLLTLNPKEQTITVIGFKKNQLQQAQDAYIYTEQQIGKTGIDAVLVSVDSVAALRKAFPNYFLDTEMFAELVNDAVAGFSPKPLSA